MRRTRECTWEKQKNEDVGKRREAATVNKLKGSNKRNTENAEN